MELEGTHQLRSYLDKLDKSLAQISASDRADIIVEIKSHITEAKARHPEQSVSDIIESLGAAEAVGNKYILERGLKPAAKPSRGGFFKWLVIGFLGTFGMLLLTFAFLIWKFTPIISVDEQNEKVAFFGGLINIDGKGGKFQIGNNGPFSATSGNIVITGARTLTPNPQITVPFKNGKMEIKTSTENVMTWSCALHSNQSPNVDEKPGDLTVDFTGANDAKCELAIPVGSRLSLSGQNGKVDLIEPQFNADVKMANGKVGLHPKAGTKYQYDLNVSNGKVARFDSEQPADFKISVNLANGKIARD